MKSSIALQFKSWTSKIHPPLPRTPRESQQLLKALNTSFRRQLDEQYPNPQSSDGTRRVSEPAEAPKPSQHTLTTSADQHFQFILNHPLFERATRDRLPSLKADSVVHGKVLDTRSDRLAERGRLLRNPMLYFDDLCASGEATVENVELCLRAQRAVCLSSSDIDSAEGMKNSAAGSRVARWFATTTNENKRAFLRSGAVAFAVPFLLAENLRNTLWKWIDASKEVQVESVGKLISRSQKMLLVRYLVAEIQMGNGISGALDTYVDASKHFSIFTKYSVTRPALAEAGEFLIRMITGTKRKDENANISIDQFQNFHWEFKKWERHSILWSAALMLCHPTQPDPTPAVRYIQNLSPAAVKQMNGRLRNVCLNLCLDTVQTLITLERSAEAHLTLDFVRTCFSAEIGANAKKDRASVGDVLNAAMLDRLDLGYS